MLYPTAWRKSDEHYDICGECKKSAKIRQFSEQIISYVKVHGKLEKERIRTKEISEDKSSIQDNLILR